MIATAVIVLMASCSKSDGEPTRDTPKYKTTTDNIVGVWRSGDHWVSFSEDGFMSAYLNDKCIAEGDYTIDGDTIKAESTFLMTDVKFYITSKADNSLSCTVMFYDMEKFKLLTESRTFAKSQDEPCKKPNRLIGKTFVYKTDVKYVGDGFPPALWIKSGHVEGNIDNHFLMSRSYYNHENVLVDHSIDYYVYLPPYIYYFETGIDYNKSDRTINIRSVSLDGNIITFSE